MFGHVFGGIVCRIDDCVENDLGLLVGMQIRVAAVRRAETWRRDRRDLGIMTSSVSLVLLVPFVP